MRAAIVAWAEPSIADLVHRRSATAQRQAATMVASLSKDQRLRCHGKASLAIGAGTLERSMSNFPSCVALPCDKAYARGVADGRRTVEAEVAAERAAVATLAVSLSDALDALQLIPR